MEPDPRAAKRKVDNSNSDDKDVSDDGVEPESYSQSGSDDEGGHDRDGDDNWENDSTQGKRSLGRSPSKAALEAARKKARGNYRCSKCGQPKKGHVCPYQPRYKRRDAEQGEGGAVSESVDAEAQVEMDPDMTVRQLPLHRQGYPDSYVLKAETLGVQSNVHAPQQPDPMQQLHNAHMLTNMLHGNPQASLLASMTHGLGLNFPFSPVPGSDPFSHGMFAGLPRIPPPEMHARQSSDPNASTSSTG